MFAAAATTVPSHCAVPNFPDTAIKTRRTYGLQIPQITTMWLHGARERTVRQAEGAKLFMSPMVMIPQCDERTMYPLNLRARTYPWFTGLGGDVSERVLRPHSETHAGPDVTITTKSVDTGERREMGSYQARRIKTTITVEPSRSAATPPNKINIDGLYIDLTGVACRDLPQPGPDVGLVGHTPGDLRSPHLQGHGATQSVVLRSKGRPEQKGQGTQSSTI